MQPPPPPESGHRRGTATSSATSAAPRRTVGCMSGLLRLLSPYHRSHQWKRLTAKNATITNSRPPSSPPPKKDPPASPSQQPQPQPQPPPPPELRRRRSCEAPRSPTIAPEHRRASCDSPRPPPPAIVARLMGLEESAPPSHEAPPPETAAEKRRKLLSALEKCDEDLKTLRRIIAAVRAAEMRAAAADDGADARAGKAKWMDGGDEQPHHKPREDQYPSPDSVLDAISSPRFPCRKRPSPCTNVDAEGKCGDGRGAAPTVGSKIVKPSRTAVFLGDYCKKPNREVVLAEGHALAMAMAIHHPVAVERIPRPPRWLLAESGRRRWRRGSSQAMVAAVGEVWEEGAGEERWEAARVAAALERAILQDLVAELVVPSGWAPYNGMCRKRLCF